MQHEATAVDGATFEKQGSLDKIVGTLADGLGDQDLTVARNSLLHIHSCLIWRANSRGLEYAIADKIIRSAQRFMGDDPRIKMRSLHVRAFLRDESVLECVPTQYVDSQSKDWTMILGRIGTHACRARLYEWSQATDDRYHFIAYALISMDDPGMVHTIDRVVLDDREVHWDMMRAAVALSRYARVSGVRHIINVLAHEKSRGDRYYSSAISVLSACVNELHSVHDVRSHDWEHWYLSSIIRSVM
jgi:hypothetical protein